MSCAFTCAQPVVRLLTKGAFHSSRLVPNWSLRAGAKQDLTGAAGWTMAVGERAGWAGLEVPKNLSKGQAAASFWPGASSDSKALLPWRPHAGQLQARRSMVPPRRELLISDVRFWARTGSITTLFLLAFKTLVCT